MWQNLTETGFGFEFYAFNLWILNQFCKTNPETIAVVYWVRCLPRMKVWRFILRQVYYILRE